jgi:hypothetical protein
MTPASQDGIMTDMQLVSVIRILLVATLMTALVFPTAYGARLNAKGQPANLNTARINNRIASRIDTRLDLRIERYRPEAASDPTSAFKSTTNDKSRSAPVIAPSQQLNIDGAGW